MDMILLRYTQTFLEANTYLIAADGEKTALVVDPGAGSRIWVRETLRDLDLECAAVLVTHGHPDHVWDAAAVAGNSPVYVPAPDRYRFDDPASYLTADFSNARLALSRMGGGPWRKPDNVCDVPGESYDSGFEIVPKIRIRAVAAPGHTEGSAVFLFAGQSTLNRDNAILLTGREEHFLLTGDVIFNGGIGRCDLPGGDEQKMAATLRFLVNAVKPETYLLPGHGPHTTMFHETRHSPFMHAAMS